MLLCHGDPPPSSPLFYPAPLLLTELRGKRRLRSTCGQQKFSRNWFAPSTPTNPALRIHKSRPKPPNPPPPRLSCSAQNAAIVSSGTENPTLTRKTAPPTLRPSRQSHIPLETERFSDSLMARLSRAPPDQGVEVPSPRLHVETRGHRKQAAIVSSGTDIPLSPTKLHD